MMVVDNWLGATRWVGVLLAAMGAAAVGPQGADGQSVDLRVGWVNSGFNGSRIREQGGLNGASLNVAFGFPVTSRLSLQPELQITLKGATRRSTAIGVIGSDTTFYHIADALRLLYVEVPVLARLELSPGRNGVRPYIAGGPYVGWLMHCFGYLNRATGSAAPSQAAGDSTSVGAACLDQGTRRLDVGLAAGAGVRVPLGSVTGLVDVRYEQGLSNAVQNAFGEAHNHALVAGVGLSILVGRRARVHGP
jgi:hypothetical protein